jgi:hypothetical protein
MIDVICVSEETLSSPASLSHAGVQLPLDTINASVKAFTPLADITDGRSGGLFANGMT